MPVFEYKGFDAAGAAVTGLVDADTVKTARSKLRKQNVFPTDVKEQTGAAVQGAGLNREIDLKQYLEFITVRDISVMTQQLAVLINAAVPVAESLGCPRRPDREGQAARGVEQGAGGGQRRSYAR